MSDLLPEDRLSLWIEDPALRERIDENAALRQADEAAGEEPTPLQIELDPGGGAGAKMDLREDGTLVVHDPFLCDQIRAAHEVGSVAVVAEGITRGGNTLCPCHTNQPC